MKYQLQPLMTTVNGKKKKVELVRGDKYSINLTFTSNKQPAFINGYTELLWSIARTIEEKDDKLASGTGTILDDGVTPSLKGKAELEIDLSSVSDDEIDHLRMYAIEFTLVDASGDQNTAGQFGVPIAQDLN